MDVEASYSIEQGVYRIYGVHRDVLHEDREFFSPHVEQMPTYRRAQVIGMSMYAGTVLHGPSKFFFSDDSLSSVTLFFRGKKEGYRYTWYQNSQYSICEKKTQKVLSHREDHAGICSIELFTNDLLHGQQMYFDMLGRKTKEFMYREGCLDGISRLFFESGEIKREISFRAGRRHGLDTMWDSLGNTLFSYKYEDGIRVKELIVDPIAAKYQI